MLVRIINFETQSTFTDFKVTTKGLYSFRVSGKTVVIFLNLHFAFQSTFIKEKYI